MIQEKALIGITEKTEIASKELIDFMKIISETNRFMILQLLFNNTEITVTDLAYFLNISQPAVSQHLKVLKLSSIVKQNKMGRKMFYSLDYCGLKNKYGRGINYLRMYFLNEK
jgi:DNA-binding transcriptional ArsR family regulator